MNVNMKVAATALAGLAVATLPATGVRAESSPRPCYSDPQVLPSPARSVPAGAPALVFIPASLGSQRPISAWDLELRGPDGELLESTLEADGSAYLIKPAASLRPGRYEVRKYDLCSYYTPTQKIASSVTVSEAVALPTTIGALATDVQPVAQLPDPTPTCRPALTYIGYVLDLSPEMAAYEEVARYTISYKGNTYDVPYGISNANGRRLQLYAYDYCYSSGDTIEGEVTITGHVAGATSDPAPLKFQLSVKCPAFDLPVCSVLVDGAAVPGAVVDAGAPPYTSNPDAAPDAGPGVSSGGGCQVSPSSARSSGLWLLFLLGAFARARRRVGPRAPSARPACP
jgi:MYXO-CTERM domain-containing protein